MRHLRSSALLLALALAGSVPLRAQTPARVMGAPFHDPSRAFVDLMIPHHQMALMMTEHALAGARTDSVRELARRMRDEQRKEIDELKAARRALFGSDSSRGGMAAVMTQMMMGMRPAGDSARPRAMPDSMHAMHHPPQGQPAPGQQRPGAMMPMHMPMDTSMAGGHDRMFLEHMIVHHEEGIDMAVLAEDSQAAARIRQLARKIREGQQRDVARMRRLLQTLPGVHPPGHPR